MKLNERDGAACDRGTNEVLISTIQSIPLLALLGGNHSISGTEAKPIPSSQINANARN
jgi:hypothetical protein